MESLATLLRGVQPHYEPVDLASLLKKLLWDKHLKTRIIGFGGSALQNMSVKLGLKALAT